MNEPTPAPDALDLAERIPKPYRTTARKVHAALLAYAGAHGWPAVFVVACTRETGLQIRCAAHYIPDLGGYPVLAGLVAWGSSRLRLAENESVVAGECSVSGEAVLPESRRPIYDPYPSSESLAERLEFDAAIVRLLRLTSTELARIHAAAGSDPADVREWLRARVLA